jgi:flagellar protein FliS
MLDTSTRVLQKRLNQYLVKEIMEATPQQLLLKIYDAAIVNCQKKDLLRTNNTIQQLINSLRFDTDEVKEISQGLLRLYLFCQDEMRKKNYQLVYKILSDLRESWSKAFSSLK